MVLGNFFEKKYKHEAWMHVTKAKTLDSFVLFSYRYVLNFRTLCNDLTCSANPSLVGQLRLSKTLAYMWIWYGDFMMYKTRLRVVHRQYENK